MLQKIKQAAKQIDSLKQEKKDKTELAERKNSSLKDDLKKKSLQLKEANENEKSLKLELESIKVDFERVKESWEKDREELQILQIKVTNSETSLDLQRTKAH